MFGLLGPNGAGKTTLLSILALLLPPSSGEIHLLGHPAKVKDRHLRRAIGLAPQELALYGDLTARENLEFFAGLYGLRGAALRTGVDEVLAAMGLADRANQRVETFSGGMQRRLNLGAAILHRPKLLLLDEPTAGVDPQSRNHLFEEIRRLNRDGVTIVYTSHYMEEVQSLCRRIGIIDHGRLVANDTLPALLQKLDGEICFETSDDPPALRERLHNLPNAQLQDTGPRRWTLHCRDVPGTLLRLIAVLKDLQIELISVETSQPNLERVFLYLTGKSLRD